MTNSNSGGPERVRSWEPMGDCDLTTLRLLAGTATRAIGRVSPDGRLVTTFGVAFVFQADRNTVLSPEAGQPARWWPLAEPPERRNPYLWEWMFERVTCAT